MHTEQTETAPSNGHAAADTAPQTDPREARIEAIENVLLDIAGALADHPDDVEVEVVSGSSENIILELYGHRDDIGKFIGKHGHHARAIRTLVQSVARKNGFFCKVEFIQPDRAPSAE